MTSPAHTNRRPKVAGALAAAALLLAALGSTGCTAGFTHSLRRNFHERVTRRALEGTALKGATGDLISAVVRPDEAEFEYKLRRVIVRSAYAPEHHSDRPPGSSDHDAFLRTLEYTRAQRAAFKEAFRAEDRRKAIESLGRALHAIHDFYSHSNFVDLGPAAQRVINEALHYDEQGVPRVPSELKLTGFDKGAEPPGSPASDPYPHDRFAKDHADANDECRAVMPDGRTKFAHVEALAIQATTIEVLELQGRLRRELGEEAFAARWDRLSGG